MPKPIIDQLHDAASIDPALRGRLLDGVTGREDLIRRAIAEGKKMGLRFDAESARRWLDRHPDVAQLAELSDAAQPVGIGGKPPI